ncbi:hypothetical protein GEMRC1_012471 [Eukaryota sp. GEM-RC1]
MSISSSDKVFVACWDRSVHVFLDARFTASIEIPQISVDQLPKSSLILETQSQSWIFLGLVDGSVGVLNLSKIIEGQKTDWKWYNLGTSTPVLSFVSKGSSLIDLGSSSAVLVSGTSNYLFRIGSITEIYPLFLKGPGTVSVSSTATDLFDEFDLTVMVTSQSLLLGFIDLTTSIHSEFHSFAGKTPRRLSTIKSHCFCVSNKLTLNQGHQFKPEGVSVDVMDTSSGQSFSNIFNWNSTSDIVTGIATCTYKKTYYCFVSVHSESENSSRIVVLSNQSDLIGDWSFAGQIEVGSGCIYSIISVPSSYNPCVAVGVNALLIIYEFDAVTSQSSALAEYTANYFVYSLDYFNDLICVADHLSSASLVQIQRESCGKIQSLRALSRDFKPFSCRCCHLIDDHVSLIGGQTGKVITLSFPFDENTITFASQGSCFQHVSNVSCFSSSTALYPIELRPSNSILSPVAISGATDGSLLLFSKVQKGEVFEKLKMICKVVSSLLFLETSNTMMLNGDLLLQVLSFEKRKNKFWL